MKYILFIAAWLFASLTGVCGSYTFTAGEPISILIDKNEPPPVHTAAAHFSDDLKLVFGEKGRLVSSPDELNGNIIIVGSIKNSGYVKSLVEKGLVDVNGIQGKWESYLIQVVEKPFPNVSQALVVVGSDKRGTAFGIFDVSRKIGVSPWYWWADVKPRRRTKVAIAGLPITQGPPSVKYRGIFLNDEDWGLKPWAASHLDTDIRDIGPKTYAKIFELLIRLKANFIWPAMHQCTKAFYHYPENPEVADKYGIVVGSSHCEPMLRNNVYEWKKNFKVEYGKDPGPWRYDTNRNEIYTYWEDRVKAASKFESVYTVGMRGIHDGSMPGGRNFNDKIELMREVIADQRKILKQYFGDVTRVPQIFCPYKEVLKIYDAGLNVPDDVTIVWPDDNFGYIRNLSTPEERKREGRAGIYYHLSYWGSPADYLWLSSISPSLISYEMSKAYAYDADRLWVFNVGDIKPAECELEFAMDLAWDVKKYPPEKAMDFLKRWAAEIFGGEFADEIVKIKTIYYRLAQNAKPEHIDKVPFSRSEIIKRIQDYAQLEEMTRQLAEKIPADRKDAFFQLILYPVSGAANMNFKCLYSRLSFMDAKNAATYAEKAKKAFEKIQQLTNYYNKTLSNGKWNKMISYKPRNRKVFAMPPVNRGGTLDTMPQSLKDLSRQDPILTIAADSFTKSIPGEYGKIIIIPNLGIGESAITVTPVTMPSSSVDNAPSVIYKFNADMRNCELRVATLPTHRIHKGRALKYAVSIDNGPVSVVNVDAPSKSSQWKINVLRGFAEGRTTHKLAGKQEHTIRLYLLDAGLVVNRLRIYRAPN